ncbi:MAG TPA: class I SAM-dependent methyltransferase [Bryobacteraceae bacterium]|nr:class I SAM-dependent methyltransferase [Bryobacteraceae bacterium]
MSDSEISARMREDWNARAREDAGYYVAFGKRGQDDAGFFATATEVVNSLEGELRRVPLAQRGDWRALEIGCGPGRLMRPMSRHFVEIHGVDVSDEMIALAQEKLRDIPNAHPHATDGATLAPFADESFDFIYSFAVFQHIPSREVVYQYFREIRRALKTGGFARLQINGLPRGEAGEGSYNTWSGARFSSSDILEFTQLNDFQVLALEGVSTQYLWTTWRKRPAGWHAAQETREPEPDVRIRRITNAHSSEPVAPCRGRFASISIWVEDLPQDAGLHHLRVRVGDSFGTVSYIGAADSAGLQQVNVVLPELEATGLLPVEVQWLGRPIAPPATLRVVPPGPSVPRIHSIRDGVNLVAGTRIETRCVKMTLEEIARPYEIEVSIGSRAVADLEFFCTDPRPQQFEINFHLPEEIGPGQHPLEIRIGKRKLAPVMLDVVA